MFGRVTLSLGMHKCETILLCLELAHNVIYIYIYTMYMYKLVHLCVSCTKKTVGTAFAYKGQFLIIFSGVGLSPLDTATTSGLLYKPQMIDEGDCGAIGGMKIGKGNRSTRRKPAAVPLCPPQIPHDQTRAAAVGSQRLTT
jgi:hypothetical protein